MRPRLCVYRSGKHIYAQVVSDESGQTLAAVSTLSEELRASLKKTATVEAAKEVGTLIAKKCQEKGIGRVVFDRNGFLYHGRIRAVAEGAREAGLQL
jgi:large subunit ribosomal protein L18